MNLAYYNEYDPFAAEWLANPARRMCDRSEEG